MGRHGAPGPPDQDTEVFCVSPHCKKEILPSEPRVRVSVQELRGRMHTGCLIEYNRRQRDGSGS